MDLRAAFSLRDGLKRLFVPHPNDVPAITGLRALSLIWVITQHVHQSLRPVGFVPAGAAFLAHPLLRLGWAGNLGVDVFFVISGYLIGGMLLREHEETGRLSFRRFYVRRAMRILPAYALAVVVYLAAGSVNGDQAWANLLFVNNFLPFRRQFMAHGWSLAIEEQFYALFPLFVVLLYAVKAAWRTPLVIASIVLFAIGAVVLVLTQGIELSLVRPDPVQFWRYMDLFYVRPYARFGGIFIGVLVARLERTPPALRFLERHQRSAALGVVLALATMAYVAFVFPECRTPGGEKLLSGSIAVALGGYTFSAAIGYLILLSRASSPVGRGLARALGLRILHPLAQISYAAYLFHPLVIGPLATRLGFDFASPWISYGRLLAASITATLICAAVIFLSVELPIMKLRPPRAG